MGLRGLDASGAEALCDRIAATGALDAVRERARSGVERAKSILGAEFGETERQLLGLVADGVVVERYS